MACTFAQSTAIAFDPISDTIWSANIHGAVSALHGAELQRGAVFQAGGVVRRIVAAETTVRAITDSCIGAWSKGGLNRWLYKTQSAPTAISNAVSSASTMFVGFANGELHLLSTTTGSLTRSTHTPSLITELFHVSSPSSPVAVAGHADGFIRTFDARSASPRSVAASPAHQRGVTGLVCSGNFVYSIGTGPRHSLPDPFVKVYDVRTLRSLASIPFPAGPAFLAPHPATNSSVAVASNTGLIQIVDVSDPNAAQTCSAIATQSFITAFAVSPTGAYFALSDAEGLLNVILHSPAPEPSFNDSRIPYNGHEGQPIEWPDPPDPIHNLEWSDRTPFNSIGLPYYSTPLLSSSFPFSNRQIASAPQKIPPKILLNMKTVDGIGYATLPKESRGRRNMVKKENNKTAGGDARFRSEKRRQEDTPEPDTPLAATAINSAPRPYRKVEIAYSKFGVEDFDFGFYNHTPYPGLETHVLNSYTNALVQVLHYTLPIRRLVKAHITLRCEREACLTCELGFVVRMLEDARGAGGALGHCQTANLGRVLTMIPQAGAMGLVDYKGAETTAPRSIDYLHLIQLFNRFVLEQMAMECAGTRGTPTLLKNAPKDVEAVTQLFGVNIATQIHCESCRASRTKDTVSRIVDLVYPKKPLPGEAASPVDFASIILTSLERRTTYRATCQFCRTLVSFHSFRAVQDAQELPVLLSLNANVGSSNQAMEIWRTPGFLTPKLDFTIGPNKVRHEYEIKGLVIQVGSQAESDNLNFGEQVPHLVALIKIPQRELPLENTKAWYIFNDFVVKNISEEEALSFVSDWKIPAIVYLERTDSEAQLIDFETLPQAMDINLLMEDISMSPNRDRSLMMHQPYGHSELPSRGTLLAIDAEFVQMQQEEFEYSSDGSKKMIRPARLSLARVSVLRGEGPMQGVPCIDDYIHTSETIVNYLTEFSGIRFGDLDPHMSRHTLVPLKVAYKKLRLLVDLGCIFVGHGLLKDFRIINIFVPRHQVIDTVDLYFLQERQRRLSLKFLTWFVLKQDIQTDTHDSIEDAKSSLLLYNAYERFEEEGIIEDKLIEIYREGKQFNYKPPSDGVISPNAQQADATAFITPSSSPSPFSGISSSGNSFSLNISPYQTSHLGRNQQMPFQTFQISPSRQQEILNASSWRRPSQ